MRKSNNGWLRTKNFIECIYRRCGTYSDYRPRHLRQARQKRKDALSLKDAAKFAGLVSYGSGKMIH